ncbi:MAG: hypothetical protein AMS15_02345 [Planctomycetes bacterium DG_23]|nr:MAG: hypothetical protein AMS15_02345 [Planctomycetes bacterium DG_23]
MSNEGKKRGRLIIISGPSGSGKSTICRRLLEDGRFKWSVSATTRRPRPGEVDGREYHFLPREEFQEGTKRGDFIEYAEVSGNLYGTPKARLLKELAKGNVLIAEVDVQGGMNLMRAFPQAISIFVEPPGLDTSILAERLRKRGQDDEKTIRERLALAPQEMEARSRYGFRVTNDTLKRAVAEIKDIIEQQLKRDKRTSEVLGG